MNKNIPIFRAKKIGSDEYVIGFYAYDEVHKRHLIITNAMHGLSETRIDITTLAIHFPDMLDSKKRPIFASLQKDGKGGDKLHYNRPLEDNSSERNNWIALYDDKRFYAVRNYWNCPRVPIRDLIDSKRELLVVGIQE